MDFDLALSRQASKALLLKRSLRSFTRFPAARSYLTASMIDVYNIWLYGGLNVLIIFFELRHRMTLTQALFRRKQKTPYRLLFVYR